MGAAISQLTNMFKKKEARICMIGLDAAGKTSILYKLKLNEMVTTIPTIGFNVEQVNYKNLKMTMWDVGGQEILRRLWVHYYEHCNAVVFVCDSTDKERMADARDEIARTMSNDHLRNARLLVYANKQDLPNALSASEVMSRLELKSLTTHKWFVQPVSAVTGQGLYEGMDWLAANIE